MTTTDNGGGIRTAAAVHSGFRANAERINERILTAFAALTEADFSRRTHFIGGRFENLYLDRDRIPELETILDQAESRAREILDWGAAPLRCGFWFNAQGPGQVTSEHTHEELDELLSGVYYLDNQSVKETPESYLESGFEGGKLVKGRKSNILVDTWVV